MEGTTKHISVLKKEVLEYLRASEGGDFLDVTLGGGGHTEAILEASPTSFVVALDRDARAIERAKKRLSRFNGRFEIYHVPFSKAASVVKGKKFFGVLADFGLSTDQLFEGRGFSFNDDGALDMRMDESTGIDAKTFVNTASEKDVLMAMRQGGVGTQSMKITQVIMRNRPFESAKALAQAVAPYGKKGEKVHPATVVFQAIRIAINEEFEEIKKFLARAPEFVAPKGRIACIAFHSDEDKILGHQMRTWEQGDGVPAGWRGKRDEKPRYGKLLTKKAIVPSEEEVLVNPSARSARMRVFEFSEK